MLSLLALALAASAGPLSVGWQDAVIDGGDLGPIGARIYYPAQNAAEGAPPDPAAGPYPLAGFLHGWLGSAWMYDEICAEIASHGFVVASLDTQSGLILEMDSFAEEGLAMMRETSARASMPGDTLEGMISGEPWVALGHSMGGATLMHLLHLAPEIRTAVAFMPYEGYPDYYEELSSWDGSLLVLSGTNDTTAPPELQQRWLESADKATRSLLVRITDMGHKAVTDLSFGEDPMPDDEQREIVLALGAAFVLAEHRGEEDRWADLMGAGLEGLDTLLASRSHRPAFFALPSEEKLSIGVAGISPSAGELFIGSGPQGEGLADPQAIAELDLPLGVATLEIDMPEPAEAGSALWIAARLDGEEGPVWTRAIEIVAGSEEPAPAAEDGDGASATPFSAPERRDSCGCSSTPVPGSSRLRAAVWLAGGLFWTRVRGRPRGRSSTSPSATSCSAATTPSATSTSRKSSA